MPEDSIFFLSPPSGTHALQIFNNARHAASWSKALRRGDACGNPYDPWNSHIWWPNGYPNIQGSNAASSVLNVDGKILDIRPTGALLSGGTNWGSSGALSGPVGNPFSNPPATPGGSNQFMPQDWQLVIGHRGYDLTSEAKFPIAYESSNSAWVTFQNTNQLGNLFACGVFSGTNDLVGRPATIIGYSYSVARHEAILPYADAQTFLTGNVANVPAVSNSAGILVLPAGPAPGIVRTDGMLLDISQCRGNVFRCADSAGVIHNAFVSPTSTAQVLYLKDGSPTGSSSTWTANVGSPALCVTNGARATPGKETGVSTEFYRGVTEDYLCLDLDDSIGSAAKPAAQVSLITHVGDHDTGHCEMVGFDCFDIPYISKRVEDAGDDDVQLCERAVDQLLAPRFYWTLRGLQNYVLGLAAGGNWVRNIDYTGAKAIPVLNEAELALDAAALLNAAGGGVTNTLHVNTGSCTSVVGFSGTNSGSSNAVVTSLAVANWPQRCYVSFHSDDGLYIRGRGCYVSSNQINLSDSLYVWNGTASNCVNGRSMVVWLGFSSIEPQQVRSPWVDNVGVWIPDTGDGGALPLSYSSRGTFSILPKSQSFLSPRSEVVDWNQVQGFRVENSDNGNAFYAGAIAAFVGDNTFHPNVRDAGNVYFLAGDALGPYYKRNHVGLISPESPDHQSIRDGLRSGTVFAATSFSIQTGVRFSNDPVWGGIAGGFTSTNTTATTTSLTFLSPGTSQTFLWPGIQIGTNAAGWGLSLSVDTGTGTNAGLGLPAYRVDRVASGVASSGANLIASFTNAASGLGGFPATISLPYKVSQWHGYPVQITPANGSPSWTARVTANTDGCFFVDQTTNTASAGDRWRVGWNTQGFDMLKTGGVIRNASGAAGDWSFVNGGSDTARLMVPTPTNFTSVPEMNAEGFRKRFGLNVPTAMMNIRDPWNEVDAMCEAMVARLVTGFTWSDKSSGTATATLNHRGYSADRSVGGSTFDLSGTNSIYTLSWLEGQVGAAFAADSWSGIDNGPFDTHQNASESRDNTPPQSSVSQNYVVAPDGHTLTSATADMDCTFAWAVGPAYQQLRNLPATTTVYVLGWLDGFNSDQVTSYGSNSDPATGCGSGPINLYAGPSGIPFREYGAVGTYGGTNAGYIEVGGPTPSWAPNTGGDPHDLILDPTTFDPIGCGGSSTTSQFVNVNGGWYAGAVAGVRQYFYQDAADSGW